MCTRSIILRRRVHVKLVFAVLVFRRSYIIRIHAPVHKMGITRSINTRNYAVSKDTRVWYFKVVFLVFIYRCQSTLCSLYLLLFYVIDPTTYSLRIFLLQIATLLFFLLRFALFSFISALYTHAHQLGVLVCMYTSQSGYFKPLQPARLHYIRVRCGAPSAYTAFRLKSYVQIKCKIRQTLCHSYTTLNNS